VIRLVTLDLYETLCGKVPARPERLALACRAVGIEVEPARFRLGTLRADDHHTRVNSATPVHLLSAEGREVYARGFWRALFSDSGLDLDEKTIHQVREHYEATQTRLELFPDALPTLADLRARGLALAIVSNTPIDAADLCAELGLGTCVDFVVSSCVVGYEKPDPRIFRVALERTGVAPAQALHVGDQPFSDVNGAIAAGMSVLLLDRDGRRADVTTCPRITSLAEIVRHL
jgi:HAD superfamily hydrolase (TIGR01509 family)